MVDLGEMTRADQAAWGAALRHFLPKGPRVSEFATPGDLAQALDPRTVQTPALRLIDAALVDVAEGRCERLMISMPPQEGKSVRTSRRFPTWMLQRNPDLRIAIVSYAHSVARRWGRAIRDDVALYGERLGLAIDPSSSAAHDWELAGQEGSVYCVGIAGALTSRAVDLLIVDDPYKNRDQAKSEAWKQTVRDFWTEVAIPRLGPGVAVVIIQTRWKDDDLTGWLQDEDPTGDRWRVINIPAQADHDPAKGETDPLGREPGEYMESARRRTNSDWVKKKAEVGAESWTALYQGRPAPSEGNIFHSEWWQRYEQPQWVVRDDGARIALSFDEIIQSWDMAFKATEGTDFVVGQVWGRRGVQAWLLDQVHARMTFVETCQALLDLSARWPQAAAKLVEDKANGPAVINALSQRIGGLIPVEPDGSKTARAAAVSPFAQAGNVFLPAANLAPWVVDLIVEAKAFPYAAHDDRVDTMTQALNRLLLNRLIISDQVFEDDEDADYEISRY